MSTTSPLFLFTQATLLVVWIGVTVFYFLVAKRVNAGAIKWAFFGAIIFVVAYYLANILLMLTLGVMMAGKTVEVQLKIIIFIQVLSAVVAVIAAIMAKNNFLTPKTESKVQPAPAQPVRESDAQGAQSAAYEKINRTSDGDASWTHILYFYGFAFLIGGCILLPLFYTFLAEIFNNSTTQLFLDMSWGRRIMFCFLSVLIAFFGFGTELKTFSLTKYVIAVILFTLLAYKTALQNMSGAPVLIPVGSGLIGLAVVWVLGNHGVQTSNWLAKNWGDAGLKAGSVIGVVLIAFMASILLPMMNKGKQSVPSAGIESTTIVSPQIESDVLYEEDTVNRGPAAVESATPEVLATEN